MLIVLTKSHDKMFADPPWGVRDNTPPPPPPYVTVTPPQEAKREAEYNMNDLNIARQEIDVLENELADVRAAVGGEWRFNTTKISFHWPLALSLSVSPLVCLITDSSHLNFPQLVSHLIL